MCIFMPRVIKYDTTDTSDNYSALRFEWSDLRVVDFLKNCYCHRRRLVPVHSSLFERFSVERYRGIMCVDMLSAWNAA